MKALEIKLLITGYQFWARYWKHGNDYFEI